MGIKINNSTNEVEVVEAEIVSNEENNKFDIVEYTNNKKLELKKSPEVEALTSKIEVEDPNTILTFGKEASEGIAKLSDSLLNTIKINRNEKNSELIATLTKIMDKFNLDDFQGTKEPSFFEKMFKKASNAVEMMFKKYDTFGGEITKIQVELEQYEREISKSNQLLSNMLDENMNFYNELQKYIVAGEMAIDEMNNTILPHYEKIAQNSGDQMDSMYYQELLKVSDMINQRVYDLRIAENIAIQTIPMLNGMKHNNYGLVRKINSAFVVTLPVFKQCLSQAILLKKQELQAKSLKALDDKTNELLLRNAQNVASQSASITRMTGTSSIQMDTLEKMYNIIKNGIDETARIEESNRVVIKENTKKLETMNLSILK